MRRHRRKQLTYPETSLQLTVSQRRLLATTDHNLRPTSFKNFSRLNAIKQILVPPYHPASNGAAERSVGLLKQALLKDVLEATYGGVRISLQHRLANFLLRYRNTLHGVTRRTPAELVMKSQVRTRFSLLKPDLSKYVEAQQMKQKLFHDRTCVDERQFVLHQHVAVRNNRVGPAKWLAGRIIKLKGPRTYIVCVGGANRFVHADHLMATSVTHEAVRPDAPGSTQPSAIIQAIATTQLNAKTQLNTTIQPCVTTLTSVTALPCVTSHWSVTSEANTRAAATPTRRARSLHLLVSVDIRTGKPVEGLYL